VNGRGWAGFREEKLAGAMNRKKLKTRSRDEKKKKIDGSGQ